MPDTFQRRQTLTNSERFISPELKEYESKVLIAQEKISDLEHILFEKLLTQVATKTDDIKPLPNQSLLLTLFNLWLL